MTPVPEPVLTASGSGLVAALTVDDGPDRVATAALLDLLAEHGVRATFCVVGQQALAPGGAALLRRTVAEGHLLAAHAMGYADLGAWGPRRVRDDLASTVAVIRQALRDPTAPVPWFRAPNGSWGCSAGVAVELGLQPVPSDANFVLFGHLPDAHATWQALLDRGVLIRDVGIPHYLRVTAGTPDETTAFLEAVADLVPTPTGAAP